MTTGIRERILARPDLAAARAARDIYALADGLNTECALTPVPIKVTAVSILGLQPRRELILSVLRDAASGMDVAARAAALMSDEGMDATDMRLEPPMVSAGDVFAVMFNDDGTEKE